MERVPITSIETDLQATQSDRKTSCHDDQDSQRKEQIEQRRSAASSPNCTQNCTLFCEFDTERVDDSYPFKIICIIPTSDRKEVQRFIVEKDVFLQHLVNQDADGDIYDENEDGKVRVRVPFRSLEKARFACSAMSADDFFKMINASRRDESQITAWALVSDLAVFAKLLNQICPETFHLSM